ncbi:branched-chain amino acid ABC transporter permease [Marinitoga sp. 1135]|uniref:Putative ABC-type transport system, permease component n=1 Tax=Marinitoga piezophila (strain DSM 14283 / JCM 11233 / KA3) TaxID=443254 RepID=H2J672_MARPK|nr:MULTISPECIES: ABC transporter permease [Marinitoga]AEX85133.1 putative ABC-type transport system, permease component [Marinitoga piezophila KA3]APT75634.1 branched-chain amino acid ABC transporter permease [Marinitoga sp. 1137]NUU95343.1 branched-chain amino acid ABC transporter permease [Marinitoga sp. 1135]NUU97277.1 branched-chain amino acid ABC transporter permease [Marinitoga sp. 1138]
MNVFEAIIASLTSPVFYKLMLMSATPLIFAALGGVFSEVTGVTNIALEGIMKLGAFTAVVFTFYTGNPWIGLAGALIAGVLFSWLHAYVSIRWSADQIVSATALILIATGLTAFLMEPIFGHSGQTDFVAKIPKVKFEAIQNVPFIGEIFDEMSIFVYLAFIAVALSWFLIYKTPLGLRMRAVGENPKAADTLGVNVFGIRYFGVLMSGLLAAFGGAYLSIGELGQFQENMPSGKGFIALAAMILGNWNPVGAMWAALLFGASDALNIQLQSILDIPPEMKALLNLLPFLVTIIVVSGFVGKTRPPAADGIPYEKE